MLSETAFAKINLALHVRRRRADGYHDLETVFAFCANGDTLTAERADRTTLTIDGPFADGLSCTDNLVVRAAEAMGCPAHLHLTKTLPVASGIGGGSADAAAALRLIARLYDRPLPDIDVQRSLGADVPACVVSETRRGEGVGEWLVAVEPVSGISVLLVNPRVPLSTGPVFAGWDGVDRGVLGDWRTGRNDLEAPARALVPEIGTVLDWLSRRHGVIMARMSGSGATCFALFESEAARVRAADEARRDHPAWWTIGSVLR